MIGDPHGYGIEPNANWNANDQARVVPDSLQQGPQPRGFLERDRLMFTGAVASEATIDGRRQCDPNEGHHRVVTPYEYFEDPPTPLDRPQKYKFTYDPGNKSD